MNFYTVAARINKQIDKAVNLARDAGHENLDEWREAITKREMTQARRNMELGIDLMLMYKEIAEERGLITERPTRSYFITVRPDTSLIAFDAFYILVQKLVQRKCFKTYTLSFEQKGTTDETIGNGFHVHIVAQMTQRSKTEVLRDIQNSVKHCTAPNCVDVQLCKNPTDVIKNYLIDYKSDDNHKAPTQEWDAKWRTREGLRNIYENEVPTVRIAEMLAYQVQLG